MPCFRPLRGYRAVGGGLVMARHKSSGVPMTVPCGRCIGCRLERSRQWAVRCMHEASLYPNNCFVTLTYDEEHLPSGGSLDKAHFQKFMKRLRKRVGSRIRFFHCGEYGDEFARPHYHALLFGFDFADKKLWSVRGENPVWRSDFLEEVWPAGQSEIGSVSFESAAYVARYCTKKVNGDLAAEHYQRVDKSTGEVFQVEPEYATMSRRPGIGRGWIEKFQSDVYPSDEVIARGFPSKPPRYYDDFFRLRDPEGFELLKADRRGSRSREEETEARLAVREVCATARLKAFSRRMESC